MAILIDTSGGKNYTQELTLGGVAYNINTRFNSRDGEGGNWYVTLYDQANNVIFSGIKVISNQLLTRRFYNTAFNTGQLICIGDGSKVTENEFGAGRRHQLYFYTDQEIRERYGES